MGTLFYRNKRYFALAVLMILAAGISAFSTVGRQEDPTISNIFATILTPYPGADPARVESLVTEKIEDELKKIPEIRNIDSTSRSGMSVIVAELGWKLDKVEIEQTWSEVRDALADAHTQFPAGVPEPEFDDDRTGAFSAISALTANPGITDADGVMRRYAELLQDRLRGVAGTKLVETYGADPEEVLVTIDPIKLTSAGLTAADVSDAIRSADAKLQAGQVRGVADDLLIEVAGEFKALERIRDIPLKRSADGAILKLGDVASVAKEIRSPRTSLAYADGRPAILVAAKIEDAQRVDLWMADVQNVMAAFEAELPAGLSHTQLFDQNAYTEDRLQFVLTNLLIGIALVVGVLFITLGWRSALAVGIIIPFAALMSLAGFQASGLVIHQMSITGLIVALGLLVDAGIVMVDEIRKALNNGVQRLEAVGQAVRRLAVPLAASTVTTALAFTPMAVLPGPAGDFVGAIAIAVIIMLISSFVLALTLAPALAGWVLPRKEDRATGGCLTNGFKSERMGRMFEGAISTSLKFPKLAVVGALVLPIIGFGAFPTLKAQFFPGVDRDQFYVQIKAPDGTAIRETDRLARKAEEVIRAFDGIKHVHWVIGESAPAYYYNMQTDQDGVASFAEALITTVSPETTERVLPELQRALDAQVPEARAVVRGLVQGPPVNAPVEIRIVGQNLETLRSVGEDIRMVMATTPDILHARTQMSGGAPKISVEIDEDKARLAGLSLAEIARQLDARMEGAIGGSLIEGSEELPVRVRVDDKGRATADGLAAAELLPPGAERGSGGTYAGIPLTALGRIVTKPSETPIYRRNGERINTVQGFTHRDVLPEEALKKIQTRIAESGYTLPAGYRFETGGDSDARNDVLKELLAVAGLIVALTVATIVLTFNSFTLSLITAIVVVLSMGLSLLALAIFNFPFGIMAVIGVIGSIGVSINAAIIILTALQKNIRAEAGDVQAITEVVSNQSRHIVSTTVTTFGGFLPLILSGGGFWPPFATAIAGGVLLSTVVSFFFVPPAYKLLRSWKPGVVDQATPDVPLLADRATKGSVMSDQAEHLVLHAAE